MLQNKENIFRIIALAIIVAIVAFWANYLSGNEAFYKRALKNRKEESYSGIVIEKYIDSSEHCTPMLKFKSNETVPLENCFWDEVEIGDSIVKIKNQTNINLYKDNKIKQVFDYNEYFQKLKQRKSVSTTVRHNTKTQSKKSCKIM